MGVYKSLKPGQPGTKDLMKQYGRGLVRVRYHHNRKARKAFTTVELIVPGSERFYDPESYFSVNREMSRCGHSAE